MFQGGQTLCQEAVKHTVCVDVIAGDRPRVVDTGRFGALTGTGARARNVVRSDLAITSAHEAVIHTARVLVLSRDDPCVVDGPGNGALTAAFTRARRIELSDLAVRIAEKSVIRP